MIEVNLLIDWIPVASVLLVVFGFIWAPKTWTPGELVTAASMNTNIRDHLNSVRANQSYSSTGSQVAVTILNPFGHVRLKNVEVLQIKGILLDGGNIDGARVVFEATEQAAEFWHESTAAASANRIWVQDEEKLFLKGKTGSTRALLIYDGTESRWRAEVQQGALAVPTTRNVILSEEFIGENVTDNQIGSLGWRKFVDNSGVLTSGNAATHAQLKNQGFMILGTGTTITSRSVLYLRRFNHGGWREVCFIVRLRSSVSNVRAIAGMYEASIPTQMDDTAEGCYFYHVPSLGPEWRTVTRDGSGSTIKATTITTVLGDWYVLKIRRILDEVPDDEEEVEFYINDVLVNTHNNTQNIPAEADSQCAKFGIINTSAAENILDADYFEFRGWNGLRAD